MIKPKVWFCAVITAMVSGCQISVGPRRRSWWRNRLWRSSPKPTSGTGSSYILAFTMASICILYRRRLGGLQPLYTGQIPRMERCHSDWREHAIRNDREHRLDREHRPAGMNRTAAPERRNAAPERKTAAPERQTVAPERKVAARAKGGCAREKDGLRPREKRLLRREGRAAPAKKAAAPEKKKEDKKDEK